MRLLALLFTLLLFSCSTDTTINISDYPVITTINELSDYYDLNIDTSSKYISTTLTHYWDGSSDLEYVYEQLEDESFDPLYYSISISKDLTISDAISNYSIALGTLKTVGNMSGQGTIEIDSLDLPGDNSYYAIRTSNGSPNGLFFSVRKGTTIYTLVLSGLNFEDHTLLTDLILPEIENLESVEL